MLLPCGLADDRPRNAPTWIYLPCSSSGLVRHGAAASPRPSASCCSSIAISDREFAAAQPRQRALGRHFGRQRRRQPAQHGVADVIAEAIVDRLEAVELDRQDGDLRPRSAAAAAMRAPLSPKPLRLSSPVMPSVDASDSRALLALDALFGFVLEVGIAAPAEQDQRDVEAQGHRRDLAALR